MIDQTVSICTFIGLRTVVRREFCISPLQNGKFLLKKTNIVEDFVILIFSISHLCSPMLKRTAVLHIAENNRPVRNGLRNLLRMRQQEEKGGPGDGTSGRLARALYLDDAPRDFGPEVAFSLSKLSFQIPGLSDRQGGREMSAPRPCVTDLFPTT